MPGYPSMRSGSQLGMGSQLLSVGQTPVGPADCLGPLSGFVREAAPAGTGLPPGAQLPPGLAPRGAASPAAAPAWRRGRTNRERRAAWRALRAVQTPLPVEVLAERVRRALLCGAADGGRGRPVAAGARAFGCMAQEAGARPASIPPRVRRAAAGSAWSGRGRDKVATRWLRRITGDAAARVRPLARWWAKRWPADPATVRRCRAKFAPHRWRGKRRNPGALLDKSERDAKVAGS